MVPAPSHLGFFIAKGAERCEINNYTCEKLESVGGLTLSIRDQERILGGNKD